MTPTEVVIKTKELLVTLLPYNDKEIHSYMVNKTHLVLAVADPGFFFKER